MPPMLTPPRDACTLRASPIDAEMMSFTRRARFNDIYCIERVLRLHRELRRRPEL